MNDFNLFITAVKDEDDIKYQPRDFRGIIAIDDGGDGWVIAATKDCRDVDLFYGNLLSDNGCIMIKGLNVGLYSCRFRPWCSTCTIYFPVFTHFPMYAFIPSPISFCKHNQVLPFVFVLSRH